MIWVDMSHALDIIHMVGDITRNGAMTSDIQLFSNAVMSFGFKSILISDGDDFGILSIIFEIIIFKTFYNRDIDLC